MGLVTTDWLSFQSYTEKEYWSYPFGGQAWIDPGNIITPYDGSNYAYSGELDPDAPNGYSKAIHAYNIANLPSFDGSYEIKGIKVEYWFWNHRYPTHPSAFAYATVMLSKGVGHVVFGTQRQSSSITDSMWQNLTNGNSSDLWGNSSIDKSYLDSNFGVAMFVGGAGYLQGNPHYWIKVDGFRIQITYKEPGMFYVF